MRMQYAISAGREVHSKSPNKERGISVEDMRRGNSCILVHPKNWSSSEATERRSVQRIAGVSQRPQSQHFVISNTFLCRSSLSWLNPGAGVKGNCLEEKSLLWITWTWVFAPWKLHAEQEQLSAFCRQIIPYFHHNEMLTSWFCP